MTGGIHCGIVLKFLSVASIILLNISMSASMVCFRWNVIGADAFLMPRLGHTVRSRRLCSRSTALYDANRKDTTFDKEPTIAIVGGGLAGLSVAYHISHIAPGAHITIFDKASPGQGGASSVAGGLLHPLTPKGKLVHLGLEGLSATNRLLDAAKAHEDNCILSDEIFRVATTEQHVTTLQETAARLPDLSDWLEPSELPWPAVEGVLGALRLRSGCRVVHMPSYLSGLWNAIESSGYGKRNWAPVRSSDLRAKATTSPLLEGFDALVLCAGSGLFHDSIVDKKFPIQLVRGQSVEISLDKLNHRNAMLSGKYISPLLEPTRVLIGATHEFKEKALEPDEVVEELRSRSDQFASDIWEDGTIDKITCGFRVQSNRGQFGRIPIVGQIDSTLHKNTWIYTGLSSRGLLHHGIFGEILASKMLGLESEHDHPDLGWWRRKMED